MPIFEYTCTTCGSRFETLLPNADAKVACVSCGSKQIERQLSTFSACIASPSSTPCTGGSCPGEGMAGSGCATGTCPFS